jgi:hypothetical protein
MVIVFSLMGVFLCVRFFDDHRIKFRICRVRFIFMQPTNGLFND